MNINCANKNLEHVGGYWEVKKETKFVKISFAGNEMPTLEAMPQTDAVVEIVLTRCNIRYLRPSLFADTPNVKFVDLSHNNLPGWFRFKDPNFQIFRFFSKLQLKKSPLTSSEVPTTTPSTNPSPWNTSTSPTTKSTP